VIAVANGSPLKIFEPFSAQSSKNVMRLERVLTDVVGIALLWSRQTTPAFMKSSEESAQDGTAGMMVAKHR
jgi:hypothetical protein